MNIRLLTLLLTITLVLSGCNLLNVLPTVDLNVSFVDGIDQSTTSLTQITVLVSVDEDTGAVGFAVPRVRFKAFSNPGGMAANITNYSIDYFYATGDKIPTGTDESFRGSVAMYVSDGISCGEEIPPCTINTPEAFYSKGEDSYSDPFSPIDLDIISRIYPDADLRSGAKASVTIEGRDANGNAFSRLLDPVTIVFRAGE